MSTIANINNNSTNNYSVSSTSTPGFETHIGSLKAEQIEDLANEVIKTIVKDVWVETTFNLESSEVVDAILLPVITKKITKAFSTPNSFVQDGITFNLFAKDNSGLLQKLSNDNVKFKVHEDNVYGLDKSKEKINEVAYAVVLSLHSEFTNQTLSFEIKPCVYGNCATFIYRRDLQIGK